MTTQVLNPQQLVREARRSARSRSYRKTPFANLTKPRSDGGQQLILSRMLTSALGVETTHVAIEHDAEAQALVIRPPIDGEPAFKLFMAGDSDRAKGNRVLAATSLRKYLGIPPTFSGRLKVKVRNGRLLIDLKPAYKKGKAASAA